MSLWYIPILQSTSYPSYFSSPFPSLPFSFHPSPSILLPPSFPSVPILHLFHPLSFLLPLFLPFSSYIPLPSSIPFPSLSLKPFHFLPFPSFTPIFSFPLSPFLPFPSFISFHLLPSSIPVPFLHPLPSAPILHPLSSAILHPRSFSFTISSSTPLSLIPSTSSVAAGATT